MIITLDNGKQVEVQDIGINGNVVFHWLGEGVYSGECLVTGVIVDEAEMTNTKAAIKSAIEAVSGA